MSYWLALNTMVSEWWLNIAYRSLGFPVLSLSGACGRKWTTSFTTLGWKRSGTATGLFAKKVVTLVNEVIFYVLSVWNYCSYLISTFDYFWVALTVWSAIQPQKALFFHFIIILQNFQMRFFFFSILQCVRHRTGELPPRNWQGHTMRVSTTLPHETERLSKQQELPKRDQKWRSIETIISDTKIGNYRQRSRLTTENQDMLLRGRWKHQGRWKVSQSGWWRWQTNGSKEKEDVIQ